MSRVYIKVQINEAVLSKALFDKGWDLRDLARQSGLSIQTVYNVCSKRSYPRMNTIKALANALGVPQTELFDLVTE